ncbi:hypothetical protein EFB14_27690 [Rhizobium fabae]|uniref:Uncharacterized protein n=1 Tax=Rhizobium fabae TaxID=573179 RepID=A0ABY0B1Z5_9HYPH|nr:hypothetical protein EFB14_27690 [Rhizobium fabae]
MPRICCASTWADARDKPEHDGRGVCRHGQSPGTDKNAASFLLPIGVLGRSLPLAARTEIVEAHVVIDIGGVPSAGKKDDGNGRSEDEQDVDLIHIADIGRAEIGQRRRRLPQPANRKQQEEFADDGTCSRDFGSGSHRPHAGGRAGAGGHRCRHRRTPP